MVDALRGYQNDDGGFGHALEPDKRCPASLPIDVETAFQALATAGTVDAGMVSRACDFLARTAANAEPAVPFRWRSRLSSLFPAPRTGPNGPTSLASTRRPGLVGLLYQLGVDHPWREAGAAYCWSKLESGELPSDAHALSETMIFLEQVPDRERADRIAAALAANLAGIAMFHLDPDAEGYGLTPLALAPRADSRWRSLFTEAQIDGHLDRLTKASRTTAAGRSAGNRPARPRWRSGAAS